MNTETDMEVRMLVESAQRMLVGKRDNLLAGRLRTSESIADLWRECVEMGWLLTCVPVEFDGAGLDTSAAASLLETVGEALLPLPVARGVATAALLAAVNQSDEPNELIAPWLNGEAVMGQVDGGVVRHAAGGSALRLGWQDGILKLQVLQASEPDFGIDPLLAVAQPGAAEEEVDIPCDAVTWHEYEHRNRVLTLAEMLGAASGALALAVTYAGERTQFGRFIGSYQAVKHPLANLRMAIDDARLALHDACRALDERSADCERRLLMAEMLVQEASHATVEQAIQTHGALGFTWECPVHFHFKRVKHIAAVLRQRHDAAVILERLWDLAA